LRNVAGQAGFNKNDIRAPEVHEARFGTPAADVSRAANGSFGSNLAVREQSHEWPESAQPRHSLKHL
jgi:hypothetical protein